ncbi:SIR2 family protein [Sporohalobacter salinus]|uniref:SIR2 family protein n=1 Tax=Sporohalobacter salinus TaxID=1494606 RepID=UPI001961F488|nr:SIR2 family protein [Sporohalobacter salinus]MBM7624449.1 hypothetical protein [Sporohalobacter salinus]
MSNTDFKTNIRGVRNKLEELDSNIERDLNLLKSNEVYNKNKIDNLVESYVKDNLVLVLGAGVSKDYGIPNWDVLLQKLLLQTFRIETDESKKGALVLAKIFAKAFPLSQVIAARYVDNYYNDKDGIDFKEAVRKALYENFNPNMETETIKQIAQLCIASGKSSNLDSIITYNYDDILERHLSDLQVDISFKSIYDVGQASHFNGLPIYHVHGLSPVEEDKESKITLTDSRYHQHYTDIYSWNNITQINKFRDKTCLFIGISLTDPNLRRLLDIANIQKGKKGKYHYIIKKYYDREKIKRTISSILEQDKDLLREKKEADLELEEVTNHIANIMENFEEKDALSFQIRTIWIDDFDEIPDILKEIRQKD